MELDLGDVVAVGIWNDEMDSWAPDIPQQQRRILVGELGPDGQHRVGAIHVAARRHNRGTCTEREVGKGDGRRGIEKRRRQRVREKERKRKVRKEKRGGKYVIQIHEKGKRTTVKRRCVRRRRMHKSSPGSIRKHPHDR